MCQWPQITFNSIIVITALLYYSPSSIRCIFFQFCLLTTIDFSHGRQLFIGPNGVDPQSKAYTMSTIGISSPPESEARLVVSKGFDIGFYLCKITITSTLNKSKRLNGEGIWFR